MTPLNRIHRVSEILRSPEVLYHPDRQRLAAELDAVCLLGQEKAAGTVDSLALIERESANTIKDLQGE